MFNKRRPHLNNYFEDGVLKFECSSDELIQLEKRIKILPILVEYALDSWSEKLLSIRFTLHSSKIDNIGHTAAYLHFGCELWTIDDVVHDVKDVSDNDIVWVLLDPISKVHEKRTRKFMPKRDLLYVILTQNSPVAYEVANLDSTITSIEAYPFSALKLFTEVETIPLVSLGKRRRHKKRGAASSTSRRM
ncbi:endonuclease [Caerostris darwini]|uniref:Endonuclease n=1 Tax=Caerostris darwini TaxID=1538125 RepID=A0AAV4SA75_9ARAC|nr:hypothetical protein CDAR_559761 [Caerostris darwini]GIY75880.1 endonuclease [Caerostris darwini]